MASIQEIKLKDGSLSFRVQIRKQNMEISKQFHTKEDAEIYAFYKEKLIDNMESFEVPIEERITLRQIFELKSKDSMHLHKRTLLDIENGLVFLSKFMNVDKFVNKINYQDWEQAAHKIYNTDVYRGAKTETGKRKMTPITLRRYFATFSSVFSHAIAKGFNIENTPLKIMQNFITPMLKKEK